MSYRYFRPLFSLVLTGCSFLLYAQGISVSPVKIYYNLQPGESRTQKVSVINQSDTKKTFEASISDWERDSVGNKVYFPAGTRDNSCSNWVIVKPSLLELGPNESRDLSVVMTRPLDKDATDIAKNNQAKCSMLFVKEIKEQEIIKAPSQKNLEAKMIIEYRLGIHIYQTSPSATTKNVDIVSFKLENRKFSSDEKERKFVIKLNNNGEQISESAVRIELTNSKTGEERKLKPNNVSMMPGTTRTVFVSIPKDLPNGEYSVVAIIDNGPDFELKIAELDIALENIK